MTATERVMEDYWREVKRSAEEDMTEQWVGEVCSRASKKGWRVTAISVPGWGACFRFQLGNFWIDGPPSFDKKDAFVSAVRLLAQADPELATEGT